MIASGGPFWGCLWGLIFPLVVSGPRDSFKNMNLQDLLKDIEFWTGLTVIGDEELTALFVNRLNRRYERAMATLGAASRLSGADDTNYANQPFSYFSIVQGQNDYQFLEDEDGNAITDITAVLIAPPDQTNFKKLEKITLDNEEAELIMSPNPNNTGIPTSYLERNNTVFFNTIPNYSKEDGAKLFYKRVPSYFKVNDLTKVPGFNAEHHQFLSLGSSYDWLIVNKSNAKTLISRVELELAKAEREFKAYAEARNPQNRRFIVKQENTR